MNWTTYFQIAFAFLILTTVSISCIDKDEWDTPPVTCANKFAEPNISLADLKALAPSSGYLLITEDVIFDGYVISTDENGNFFKTIVFQDHPEHPTAGMQIEVDRPNNYADFPLGSHIRINAKGLRLGLDRGSVKLGSVDEKYPIGRIPGVLFKNYISAVCAGNSMDIQPLKPVALSGLAEAMQDKYINTLVTVNKVQFTDDHFTPTNQPYVNYVGGQGEDTNRTIIDLTGTVASVRSSGFANYGATLLPNGNGSITFVVSKFNSDFQMLIRGLADVKLDKARISLSIETFSGYNQGVDDFSPKYVNIPVVGTKKWYVQNYNNNKYIQISGQNAGLVKTHFAVPVNFSNYSNLSFKTNAGYYNGDVLKVYWSTNYNPANPTVAVLHDITAQFDISKGKIPGGSGSNYETNFRPSGIGTITTTGNGYVVFEYNSNSVGGVGVSTVMQVDDISVF